MSITNHFVSNPELKRRGQEVFQELFAGGLAEEMHEEYRAKSTDIEEMSLEWAIGGIIGRPGLDLKTRELICVALCCQAGIGLGPVNDPVIAHSQAAVRAGATKQEVYEAVLQCIWYLGAGPPQIALTALKDFFAEDGDGSSAQ